MTATQKKTMPHEPMRSSGSLIVSSSVLRQAMGKIAPFVSTNPIVPILENVLWIVKDGVLTLTGSDLQTSISVVIPIDSTNEYRACVPIKEIASLMAMLPEQPLTIVSGYLPGPDAIATSLTIRADSGSYEFEGLESPMDFPKLPAVTPEQTFTMPVDTLRAMMRQASEFLSRDDLRPALTGVKWQVSENGQHELAATDGHRLIRIESHAATQCAPFSTILPGALVRGLTRILPPKGDNVTMEIGGTNMRVSWGAISITARIVDERFPDYNAAIPTSSPLSFRVDKRELIAAVRRALLFSNSFTHQISLETKADTIHLQSQDLDYSRKMKERVGIELLDGDKLIIGVNAKTLLGTLKAMPESRIEIRMSSANRAILLFGVTDKQVNESVLCLLMPVMLSHYDY